MRRGNEVVLVDLGENLGVLPFVPWVLSPCPGSAQNPILKMMGCLVQGPCSCLH